MSMETLMTGMQTSLKNAAGLSYVADADIFVTSDENILPIDCGFPAIGLKDGPVSRQMSAAGPTTSLLWDVRYRVHVITYVEMSAGETPVIGQTSPSIKGILKIGFDIAGVLHENYQSIAGVLDAYCVEEEESEVVGGKDLIILKKRQTYEYWAQEIL